MLHRLVPLEDQARASPIEGLEFGIERERERERKEKHLDHRMFWLRDRRAELKNYFPTNVPGSHGCETTTVPEQSVKQHVVLGVLSRMSPPINAEWFVSLPVLETGRLVAQAVSAELHNPTRLCFVNIMGKVHGSLARAGTSSALGSIEACGHGSGVSCSIMFLGFRWRGFRVGATGGHSVELIL